MEARNFDSDALKELLANRPSNWWYVLAFRAALRILPFVVSFHPYRALSSGEKAEIYLNCFRAAQSGWVALRYPNFDLSSISKVTRTGSRVVGQAATTSGAVDAARVAYAMMDATAAILQDDMRLAVRALAGAQETAYAAVSSAGDSFSAQLLDDVERLIELARTHQPEVSTLAAQRLWRGSQPRWSREIEKQLSKRLAHEGGWEFWLAWHQARVKGTTEFNLSAQTSEWLNKTIAQKDERWWEAGSIKINAEIKVILEYANSQEMKGKKTVSQFAVDFIKSQDVPVSIAEIAREFSRAGFPVIQKTLRGELSRLTSSGQIVRVAVGKYQAKQITPEFDLASIPAVESQSRSAVQFEAPEDGAISVKRRGGALLGDRSARRRHEEVLRYIDKIIAENIRTARGGNVSVGVLEDIFKLKESLGESVEDVDPDLLIPRGDGLRRDLIAYERRDELSNLPPIPDKLLLDLGKLVANYNNYVSYDPELANRDEALLGPDARKKLVPPEEGQRAVAEAVRLRAAVQEVVDVLGEEARVAPAIPDAESRQSRRYSEGAKNFARIAIGRAIDYANISLKVGAATGGVVVSGYHAAQWVIANESWLLKYFSQNPTMTAVIEKLIQVLHSLPLS